MTSPRSEDLRLYEPDEVGNSITYMAELRRPVPRCLGHAWWHPADGPSFDYLEFHVDRISYLEPGDPGRSGLDAREVVGSR